MKIRKHVKLFEDLDREGFVRVGKDFDQRLKDAGDMVQRQAETYSKTVNQIKIDLVYAVKWAIRYYLERVESGENASPELYHKEVYDEVKGILYKFSEGKYASIKPEDVPIAKDIVMSTVNEVLPYDKVTWAPMEELKEIATRSVDKMIEQGIFDSEKGYVWDERKTNED